MNRRELLKWSVFCGASASVFARLPLAADAGSGDFAWANASVTELQAALTAGTLTSRALCEAYLARIAKLNLKGPELRAVLEVNPDALTIADALDAERKAKGPRGPLHGIPVAIKDNIDTGDTMQTTAGSLALLGSPAPNDAFIVKKLRDAGCVVLCKTNLSEWANLRSTRSTSGWSARGGQARNPYALDRSPIGSSSGSGVAVAADLCAIAVGTETDGSITCPASAMSLVGLKPTVGLLSRTGIIPISPTQDTPGPMTRTVEDAAVLLSAMVGEDADDAATRGSASHVKDYRAALKKDALSGVRLGVVRENLGGGPQVRSLMDAAFAQLVRLGATLVDVEEPKSDSKCEDDILYYELKASMAKYLETRRPKSGFKKLADLIAFNNAHADAEMPFFGQESFERAEKTEGLNSKKYQHALTTCRTWARTQFIDALLAKHKLSALVTQTLDPAWLIDPVLGDHFTVFGGSLAAVAGYPSLTVPAGEVSGLPVGLLFIGTAWSEATLLAYAYAYEQATKLRRPPTFAPTLTPRY